MRIKQPDESKGKNPRPGGEGRVRAGKKVLPASCRKIKLNKKTVQGRRSAEVKVHAEGG